MEHVPPYCDILFNEINYTLQFRKLLPNREAQWVRALTTNL